MSDQPGDDQDVNVFHASVGDLVCHCSSVL